MSYVRGYSQGERGACCEGSRGCGKEVAGSATDAGAPEPNVKVARMREAQVAENEG